MLLLNLKCKLVVDCSTYAFTFIIKKSILIPNRPKLINYKLSLCVEMNG